MPAQMGIEEIPGVFTPQVMSELADATFWPEKARDVVKTLCRTKASFTVDDVYEGMDGLACRPGLGSVLRSMAHEGTCQASGTWIASRREGRENRPVRVWLSLIR